MADQDEFGAEQTQDDPMVGQAPAGDANPGDYESNDQSGGRSDDTGVTYDAAGEPESTPHDEDTDVEDSNPNAAGPGGLEGDMGISSERTIADTGDTIEGTGSVGSSTTGAEGTVDTSPGEGTLEPEEQDERPDMEKANADIAAHEFDRDKSPGHSHG